MNAPHHLPHVGAGHRNLWIRAVFSFICINQVAQTRVVLAAGTSFTQDSTLKEIRTITMDQNCWLQAVSVWRVWQVWPFVTIDPVGAAKAGYPTGGTRKLLLLAFSRPNRKCKERGIYSYRTALPKRSQNQ